MRILSKEEATKVERSERDPWVWPDAVCAAASNSFSVLPVTGARTPDGDPLALGVTVRILETLYDQGYVIAKLNAGEVAPTTIDPAAESHGTRFLPTEVMVEGVPLYIEATVDGPPIELVNTFMGAPEVEVGQVWVGITGNRLVVREVTHGRARLSYEDDPGDETWEDVEDIRTAFTLATHRVTQPDENSPGTVLVDAVHEQWLAEGTE